MYVHQLIPNLIGGVSQQNSALRLENQCEAQVNWHCTATDGLIQRPNTEWIKTIGDIEIPTIWNVHAIERDENEKYIVIMTTYSVNPIRVFDLEGNEKTVNYGNLDEDLNFTEDLSVKNYLTDGGITNAFVQIKAITVADYTIIVNTQKTVQKHADTLPALPEKAYVYVKSRHKGEHQVTLRWTENDQLFHKSWSTITSDNGVTETNGLAGWFVDNAPVEVTDEFYLSANKSVLTIWPKEDSNVDEYSTYVETDDPWGNQDLIPINNHEVSDIADLPPKMTTTCDIKVIRDSEINQDDYWMRYDNDRGSWYESRQPGSQYKLDSSTMPHRLVRMSDGTFVFGPCIWKERFVGDDDTNPWPSFVNQTISNVVFHKNRFWFLSRENIISSQAGEFFNFFRPTVMEILDDDPIDISVASERVNKLISAMSFEQGLVLFGETAQFILHSGDQVLTTKSVVVDQTVRFSLNTSCNPVKMGSSIYFPGPQTNLFYDIPHTSAFLSIREYTVMPDTVIQDAPNVTMHVPRYIPNGALRMTGCDQLDMLFVYSYSDPYSIYVHQFLWEGNQKIQQAWFKWTFDTMILHIEVIGTHLYLLVHDDYNGFKLEVMDLENTPTATQDIRYHLDDLVLLTGGTYSEVDDKTTFSVPFLVGETYVPEDWEVIDNDTNVAFSKNEYNITGFGLEINGDHSEKSVWLGRNYTCTYQFSTWYFKDERGRPLLSGNVQVKRLILSFLNSGPFKVVTTPLNRSAFEEPLTDEMSGIKIGESVVGEVKLLTGEHSFLIASDTKLAKMEVITDSYLPVSIQTAVWEGIFTIRGSGGR